MQKTSDKRGRILFFFVVWFLASVLSDNADGAYMSGALLLMFGISTLANCQNPARFIDRMADAIYPVRFELACFVPVLLLFGAAAIVRRQPDFLGIPLLHGAYILLLWKSHFSRQRRATDRATTGQTGQANDQAGQRQHAVHDAHLHALGLRALPHSREALSSAWKAQMRRVHPDLPGGSAEKAKAANVAYHALSSLFSNA